MQARRPCDAEAETRVMQLQVKDVRDYWQPQKLEEVRDKNLPSNLQSECSPANILTSDF